MSNANAAPAMQRFAEATEPKYFVHYKVQMDPAGKDIRVMVAGPYSERGVLDQRRDIATYEGVTDAYVSTDPQPVGA